MVRKVVTLVECDVCPHQEVVECPKGILGYRMSEYPPGWQFIQFGNGEGDWLCPKCARGAQQNYTKYKQERQRQEEKKKGKR